MTMMSLDCTTKLHQSPQNHKKRKHNFTHQSRPVLAKSLTAGENVYLRGLGSETKFHV